MSSFTGSFGDESRLSGSTRPFDDDGYLGYDPCLPSQRFDSFSNLDADSVKDSANNDTFSSQTAPSIYASGIGFSAFSPEQNGKGFDGGFGHSDGPILPPPSELQPEEGFALREWRRLNSIRLEEKEKKEKKMLQQIIEEAEHCKAEFYRKHKVTTENKKAANREKEKLFLASQEKFHAEAEKNYWKAVAEVSPHEVPAIEKRGKKNQEKKKPSIVVIQGPKPGKPTDLSRMCHILVKLKHNPPPHMKVKPPPSAESKKDTKTGPPAAASGSGNASIAPPTPKAVAAA